MNEEGVVEEVVHSARARAILDTAKLLGAVGGVCILIGIVIGQQISTRARAARYRNE